MDKRPSRNKELKNAFRAGRERTRHGHDDTNLPKPNRKDKTAMKAFKFGKTSKFEEDGIDEADTNESPFNPYNKVQKQDISRLRTLAGITVNEAGKPDFADIDNDGDKDETVKKAAIDKKKDESAKTEQEQMREWANSIYKQYDDKGHYQEQPEGETVDLSLRRYLNATPTKVSLDEDISQKKLSEEYKKFKSDK